MSSAKRTPRYVDAILPFEVVERSMSADVIRLRPGPHAPALPPITEAWPRAKAVPLSRRPWQLLLVPPTPGAPTRSYLVARWQARLVLAFAVVVLVVAGAGVTTLVVALRSPDIFASGETEMLRARLTAVEDSLALALTELDAPGDSLAASAATTPGAAPSAAAAARRPAKVIAPSMRPARRTAPGAVSDDDSRLSSSAFEGLPVIGAIASRFSRARRHPLLHVIRPHLGVDVAAPRGTKITAPAPGRVAFVGRRFGFGLVVEIEHGSGITTRYAHCGTALVNVGARIQRGVPIATVGTSGLSTGPHLHYEVLVNGRQVDPLRFKMPQEPADSATSAAARAISPSVGPPTSVASQGAPLLTPQASGTEPSTSRP
jgi:murein DD-endopeptidase MepM/ murein hydrolase activator NlpD